MKSLFLRAKHWQLFLAFIVLPFIIQMLMFLNIFSSMTNGEPSIPALSGFVYVMPFIILIIMGVLFGWFWSVAMGLQHMIPQNISMKTKKFRFFFNFMLVYIVFFLGLMLFLASSILAGNEETAIIFLVVIPFHLFAIFCMFYVMYFVAKTIKTAEVQMPVTFSDFAGEFFLIWLFPIGIWIIQPRVNKLIGAIQQ